MLSFFADLEIRLILIVDISIYDMKIFRYINAEFVCGARTKPILQATLHSQPPPEVFSPLLTAQHTSSVTAPCTIHSFSDCVTSETRRVECLRIGC
jgi:hypothetical protein